MTRILFVCHGNICRSPMAEFVMKDLVRKAGLASQFQIASAATSRKEIGDPVYPPARRKLAEPGISCSSHATRQLTNSDYEEYDLLIGMDKANLRDMYRICGGDFAEKCTSWWTSQITPTMSPPRGTPTISKQPGGIYWRADRDYSTDLSKEKIVMLMDLNECYLNSQIKSQNRRIVPPVFKTT